MRTTFPITPALVHPACLSPSHVVPGGLGRYSQWSDATTPRTDNPVRFLFTKAPFPWARVGTAVIFPEHSR